MSAEINTDASSKDVFDEEFDEATTEEDDEIPVQEADWCGCSANTHNPAPK